MILVDSLVEKGLYNMNILLWLITLFSGTVSFFVLKAIIDWIAKTLRIA